MLRNNGPDWGNIYTLWFSICVAVVVTARVMDGTMDKVLATIVMLSMAAIGAELVGRQ